MLNKKNIACLIFVFLSLKIYAEDDFNVISQCTDEYETSCDLVWLCCTNLSVKGFSAI